MKRFILLFLALMPSFIIAQPSKNWWNQSVFYELFVRSFYDSNGNGIGDFNGITAKLNYLNDGDSTTNTDLGINAIWLMPINASPSYHGYDVTDYKAVNPQYGSASEFKNMVKEAHKRGIKIVIDFVINHTSSQHPWFVKSVANDPFYRDFYRWNTSKPNYKGSWGQDVWYSKNNSNYYALFWSEMPDLNYTYQPVKDSIFNAAKYWLDSMDIDGFRLDAAMYLYESGANLMNQPETFQFWTQFNTYIKSIKPNVMTVGEVWTSTSTVKQYNNKLDYCFEFELASSILSAVKFANAGYVRQAAQYAYDNLLNNEFASFLTNHDQNRVYDELGGNDGKMKAAASMYLALPGIPYIYYGEEIGLRGSKPDENIRTPMQWNNNTYAGFSAAKPWQSVNSNYPSYNIATMSADSNSLLNHYKKLIAIRNQNVALTIGTYQNILTGDSSVYAFTRQSGNQKILVMVNTSSRSISNLAISTSLTGLSDGNYSLFDLMNKRKKESMILSASFADGLSLNPYQCKVMLIESATGVKEIEANVQFNLYPNPANEEIQIELLNTASDKDFAVYIFDALGKELKRIEMKKSPFHTISVADLKPGFYYIRLNNGIAKSFVKK